MALSEDLISQFVRITNDNVSKNSESTHYGTVVRDEESGTVWLQLDGSDEYTPITTTADYIAGERVIVRIKDHTATIIGNLSSPAARTEDVKEAGSKITKVENLVADKVSTDQLAAESARIDDLVVETAVIKESLLADDAEIGNLLVDNIEIKKQLSANKASIDNLSANKLDATVASATYATIENLDATNIKVHNLESTYGTFEQLTTKKLEAVDAEFKNIDSKYATITALNVEKGRIDDLEADMITADHAVIKDLEAGIAEIDTLIFGSATGDVIQSSFANAVIAQLGNAQIKSAMIESVAANKITSGDIITNNVRVMSEDGSLIISDETMQISDENRVRVQIGKDADNDYSINIWDQNGNLMFSKGGITDSAIKDKIIRDDMVSDTANIAAHKLDIDSLFEEINGSTKTIKSTRVYLDEKAQALDVAFKAMETDMSGLGKTVSSQGTQLTTIQGQISSKVWQQDIDTAKGEMSTQYSVLKQDLDSFESTVNSTYATKTELGEINVGVRNLYVVKNSVEGYLLNNNASLGVMNDIRQEHTSDFIPVREGESYVFQVWVTVDEADVDEPTLWMAYSLYDADKNPATNRPAKRSMNVLPNGQCYDLFKIDIPAGAEYIRVSARLYSDGLVKLEKGTIPTEWSQAPEDIAEMGVVAEISNNTVIIRQDLNGLESSVTNTYATKSELNDVANNVSTVEERIDSAESTIKQQATSIGLCATKSEVESVKTEAINSANANTSNLLANYSTTSQMNAAIQVSANAIQSSVSSTYATKSEVNNVDDKFENYSTTVQMNSAIEQQANSIRSSVSSTYATKTSVTDIKVGGRNLYIEKNAVDGFLSSNGDGSIMAPGGVTKEKTSELIPVSPGDDVRFQVWVTTPEDSYVWYGYQFFKEDGTALDTNRPAQHLYDMAGGYYHAEYSPIVVPEGAAYIRVSVRMFEDGKIKVEIGNKATDWTPAPEDMATEQDVDKVLAAAEAAQETASNAETLIQQLSHSISMLVTDGNGTSLMTQTEDGWTFSTADIQANVAEVAELLDTLTNNLGSTDNTVDVLERAVADLGEIAEYVKIGTYENEPCIELGESDSEFKMRITNTRILFMEGSNIVAHISNQSLHIKKAVIEEELQQGDFVWQIRSNGNLGLIWKGVSS